MKRKNAPRSRKLTRSLSLQTLECRQVLAASVGWDGPGQGSTTLTYHVSGQAGSLTQAQTNAAIEKALSAWSSVANITFTPTTQAGLKNSIDISFTKIDGVGGTLAQAYFPKDVNPEPIAGNIQFDSSESWEIGNAAGSSAVDLVYVAIHEIGHALGLDHTTDTSSVMYPSVSPTQSFVSLNASDVAAIQKLYGSSSGTTTSTGTTDTGTTDSGSTGTGSGDTGTTTGSDTPDTTPFPKGRWHRHGSWHRWGDRVDFAMPEHNYVLPSDVNLDSLISALDALLIINQISRSSSSSADTDSVTDLANRCDTSGDGSVTALDALRVINSLSRNQASSTPVVAPISTPNPDSTDEGSTDTTDDGGTDTTDSGDTGSTDNTDDSDTGSTDNTDDSDNSFGGDGSSTPTDDTDTTEDNTNASDDSDTGTGSTDDNTDDDSDTTDDNTDSTDDSTDDDSDTTDDETDTTDDSADEEQDCPHPDANGDTGEHSHSAGHGRHHLPPVLSGPMLVGVLGTSAEDFVSRFDTSADGSLTEDELPPGLWSKLISLDADADDDAALSLDEVDALITSVMKSHFDKRDTNSDGELTADEVGDRLWASLGTADTDSSDSVSFDEFKTWLEDQEEDSAEDTAEDDSDSQAFGHSHHGRPFGAPLIPVSFGSSVNQVVSQVSSILSGRRR